MQIKKSFILIIGCWLLVSFLSGCATTPGRAVLPTYNIDGVSYVSLASLCKSENIRWEYDTYTGRAYLNKGTHRINLMVGQRLVLVDGMPQYLKHPVDIYQGAIVLPFRFKEQILDVLFKNAYSERGINLSSARIKKIVIDAGHGGRDPGTIGKKGLKEKDVNLDIAKRLAKLLRDDGIEVVMTRSTDDYISLERRVAIANNSKADLFVSIHANANRVRSLNGLEVYYITPHANDSKRALQSAQNVALNLDRSSFAYTPSLNLKAILWDMKHTSNRAESVKLARNVCISAGSSLDTKIIGIKGAPFYVLKGAHMPAVLIEVGFLSNYNEERLIRNSFYRQQLAESIEMGITKYARNLALIESASR
ncbi:MAG: N-acetylmuramoyl-L-alanine amidase [Candidatus Omnitrophica bacterium]|nr:N-acetylmuramoyl-L-alanine amidase [Candidatus Omnitrophota bacterium]